MSLLQRLGELGLLKAGAASRGESLAELCFHGRLVGGLSIAKDLTPDELVGPLCREMGASLKVIDVRTRPAPALIALVDGVEKKLRARTTAELVKALNTTFKPAPDVRVVAWLGEWEGMFQLWCVEKKTLAAIRREEWFHAD